jgi:hypothetical protein
LRRERFFAGGALRSIGSPTYVVTGPLAMLKPMATSRRKGLVIPAGPVAARDLCVVNVGPAHRIPLIGVWPENPRRAACRKHRDHGVGVIAAVPVHADACYQLARIHERRGERCRAEELINAALALGPHHGGAQRLRDGLCLLCAIQSAAQWTTERSLSHQEMGHHTR